MSKWECIHLSNYIMYIWQSDNKFERVTVCSAKLDVQLSIVNQLSSFQWADTTNGQQPVALSNSH